MKKTGKNKKSKGCLKTFVKAALVFSLFAAGAVFVGYRYIRPFILERITQFDPDVFGFEAPEGFSSLNMPIPPWAGNYDVAVLRGRAEASEILDRISLNAVHSGWTPEKILSADVDFDIEKVKDIISRKPDSPAETLFFREKKRFLFLSAVPVGETVYIAVVSGDTGK